MKIFATITLGIYLTSQANAITYKSVNEGKYNEE